MKKSDVIRCSFRCYYGKGEYTTHYQEIKVADIPKWIEAYKYTHPDVKAITVRIPFEEIET